MTHTIDITKEHCPMTFVKVKLKLARIESGDTLDVLLAGAEPLKNVPRAAVEQGHKVVSVEEQGAFYRVLIEKK